ncbi:coiled-coil domain-containing protein 62-like isoform X3 [Ptychodera flava]|uniref:coiled-coil domain-containing protein 62-like isoform X3 n=1 Tax=Ptychodera flava TaxID=63121 RepID=UPI00396A535E
MICMLLKYQVCSMAGTESGSRSVSYEPQTSTPKCLSPSQNSTTAAVTTAMTSYSSPTMNSHHTSPAAGRQHTYTSPVRYAGSSPLSHRTGVSPNRGRSDSPTRTYHSSPPRQNYMSELEAATIQKQRRELQLLIAELQDRDRELNDMVHAHHKQLLAWDEDRQKLLALEQRCSRYDAEIRGKNDQIKHLASRLKIIETQEQSKTCALESTQKQLEQLSEKASSSSMYVQDLEDRNRSLTSTVRELSAQLGQLEAREQELLTVLKLKDKDLLDASSHITDVTSKLKRFDAACKELRQSELASKREITEWKQKLGDTKAEVERLRGELGASNSNNTEQQILTSKAREEAVSLKKELQIANEREKRKDQLLELQKSRQDRVEAELNNLRQVYDRQQKEMALMQLNLESKDELLALQECRLSDTVEELSRSLSPSHSISPSKSLSRTSTTKLSPKSPSLAMKDLDTADTSADAQAQDGSSGETDELLNITANDLTDNSPTSKLHRLLSESREMVRNLEQTTLPPYFSPSH